MAYFLRLITKYTLFTSIGILVLFLITRTDSFAENRYVGTTICAGCHQEEYKRFMQYAKKSRSFQSIEKLKKGLTEEEIKSCYKCHTTGYGRPGGFESPEKTPDLKNNGCEVCHGPGEAHVKSSRRQDIKIHMTKKDCEVCHIEERVAAFRYKPLIHGGAH